jgi:hypothetical protein
MDDQPDPPGFVPVERIALLKDDMSGDEVRAILGSPASTQPPSEVVGPTEVFQSFGSSFSFAADRDIDEIWVYRHRRRGKLLLKHKITTYLGFRMGILQGAWKDNSQLRAAGQR